MKDRSISIERKEEIEFEFEDFSVIYVPEHNIWFIDIGEVFVIEDEEESFEDNKEFCESVGFTEEDFIRLKNHQKRRK
jgi:hypothetical protein